MKYLLSILFFLSFLNAHTEFKALENYRDPIDGESLYGWAGPMQDFQKKLDPNKNYAIAILHKPVNAFLFQDIYWFRSTVIAARKQLEKDAHGQLGHFQVAWSCKLPGEERRFGMTGQTGEQSFQGLRMLTQLGYGMSLFFANFTDGYLQSSRASIERIESSISDYGFNWVAFEISTDDCEQGYHFLNKYIESRAYENFSFVRDPNKLEGGGCTSFASELLFQFGAFRGTLINAWKTKFGIPKSYLANPSISTLPNNTELPDFLFEPRYRKTKANLFAMAYLPTFSLKKNRMVADIYDTELILYSLHTMVDRAFREKPAQFPANFLWPERKAYGLMWEGQHLKSAQRSHFIKVNNSLGFYFQRLYNYTNHKDISLPRFTYTELNHQPGVIFRKPAW